MGQRSYTAQYRADAVKLAQEIGSSGAARELKMPADTLYTWVSRAKTGDLPSATTPIEPGNAIKLAEKIKQLEQENKALKGELIQRKKEMEILEGAAVFFASRQKK